MQSSVWFVRRTSLVCALAALLIPGAIRAQQLVTMADGPARQAAPGTSVSPNVLDVRISVDLVQASLKTALDAIAKESGVQILYSHTVVPIERRVTVRGTEITMRAALRQALDGTNMEPQVMAGGKIVIAPVSRMVQGVIVGKVVNAKTKQGVVGATILVDGASKGVLTADGGVFRLTLAPGEHQITVRAVGFMKQARMVTVRDEETVTADFTLEVSTSVLNEVIVTGTVVATERKAIPTPITVITADEIEKRGITRLEQFMRGEIPGLVAIERGSMAYSDELGGTAKASIYSRGSSKIDGSGNPIKIYVDGIEMLDPSYVGTIDPKSIERIEIITGPQAATIYGSGAMGGVMQIFTKRGSGSARPSGTLSVLYGMLQNNFSNGIAPAHTDALNLTGGTGPEFSYSGTLSYNYTGQWQPMLFNRRYGASAGITHMRGRITLGGSASTTSQSNGTYRTGFSNSLGYATRMQDGRYFWNSAPPYSSYLSRRVSYANTQTVSINVDGRATASWQHHLTAGRSQTGLRLEPDAPSFSYGTVGSDTLYATSNATGQRTTAAYNTTLVSSLGSALSSSLTFGITANNGEQYQFSGCMATEVASSIVGCTSGAAPTVQRTLRERNWGEFVSWRLGVLEQLYLTLGLRAEQNPAYGRKVRDLQPTNGITYTIERGDITVKLLASYGHATRAPLESYRLKVNTTRANSEPAQYVSQFEAPELRPETSYGPQGGVELYYGNLASLTVNHYSQTVKDLIQRVRQDSIPYINLSTSTPGYLIQFQYQNIARIRQFGWEATGSLNAGPVSVKGTYSWNDSRLLEVYPVVGVAPLGVFDQYMSHTGNITVGFARGRTSLTLATNYTGKLPDSQVYASFESNENFYIRDRMYAGTYNGRLAVYPLPGYTKSDLAASYRLTSSVSAILNVVNLENTFTSEYGMLNPALGRQTSIGFTLKFPGRR